MSLRHPFPDFVVNPHDHAIEPHRTPPKLPAPTRVEFRTGGDLTEVLAAIRDTRYVRVDAAVGTGKSVRLPQQIAQSVGRLVVHVVPSRLLAHSLCVYVAKSAKVAVQELTDVYTDMITEGLVFMHTAVYSARTTFTSVDAVPSHVLYLDEAHESDGATKAVRDAALSRPFVERLVLASATSDPSNFRQRETAGSVQISKYPGDRYTSSWNVTDEGMPWYYDNLDRHALFYVERDAQADRLMADYRDYGFVCHRITARTSVKTFDDIVKSMYDHRTGIVLLFADYSYRSGFTLPVDIVVDSGEVAYVMCDGTQTRKLFRRTYFGEQEQAVGRIGRIAGTIGRAYVPDCELEYKICDLEGVECDAAVLLMRFMGYKPPINMAQSPLTMGDVPMNLSCALNGPTPLRMLPMTALARWPGVTERGQIPTIDMRSQVDGGLKSADARSAYTTPAASPTGLVSRSVDSTDLVAKLEQAQISVGQDENVSPVDFDVQTASGEVSSVRDCAQVFEDMLHDNDPHSVIEIGRYYYYPGAERVPERSIAFPNGLNSIMEMGIREDFPVIARGLAGCDHAFAVSTVLSSYNNATAELMALKQIVVALPEYKQRFGDVSNKAAVNAWLTGVANTLTIRSSQVSEYSRILVVLSSTGYQELGDMRDMEKVMVDYHVTQLVTAIREVESQGRDNYRRRVIGGLSPTINSRLTSTSRYIEPGGRSGDIHSDSHVRRMLTPGTGSRPRSQSSVQELVLAPASDDVSKHKRWRGFLKEAFVES